MEFGFSNSIWDATVLGALAGNLLILVTAWLVRKRYPGFLFGVLWFYIAISPASSIIPLAEPVNDHRMYIAYFGLAGVIFPWMLKGIEVLAGPPAEQNAPRAATGIIFISVLIALMVGTQVRNQAWSSQESLWGDTIAKNPRSGRAINNLAVAHMEKGNLDTARALLNYCEQVAPTYAFCRINQALLLAASGHDAEAESKFKEGIGLQPSYTINKLFYGEYLQKRGLFEQSIDIFKDLDRQTGGRDLRAKIDWIRSSRELGQWNEAKALLEDAKRAFPGNPVFRTEEFR